MVAGLKRLLAEESKLEEKRCLKRCGVGKPPVVIVRMGARAVALMVLLAVAGVLDRLAVERDGKTGGTVSRSSSSAAACSCSRDSVSDVGDPST